MSFRSFLSAHDATLKRGLSSGAVGVLALASWRYSRKQYRCIPVLGGAPGPKYGTSVVGSFNSIESLATSQCRNCPSVGA